MQIFSAMMARSPVDSSHKGQWHGTLLFSLTAPEQTVEQTIETPVIWDAITLIMALLQWYMLNFSDGLLNCRHAGAYGRSNDFI